MYVHTHYYLVKMENRTSTVMKVDDVAVWSRFSGRTYVLGYREVTFTAWAGPWCQTTLSAC